MRKGPALKAHRPPTAEAFAEYWADDFAVDLALFFKVFGDATRLKILSRLAGSPLCVGDLARALGMTSSSVSHQLKTLKDTNLVRARKNGKSVTYSLQDEHVKTILSDGSVHLAERRKGRA